MSAVLSGCCLSTATQDLSTRGATSNGTSTGATTGGGTTSGVTSGGTTGNASAGSTTGPPRCADGGIRVNGVCVPAGHACGADTVWVGDTCVAQDCPNFAGLPCQLADGGLGICTAGFCVDLDSDPNNCDLYGFVCPSFTSCISGRCEFGDGGLYGCPPPRIYDQFGDCVLQTCAADTDNQACADRVNAPPGLCCSGSCIQGSQANCGGCGIRCAEDAICLRNDSIGVGVGWDAVALGCVPAASCDSAGSLLPWGSRLPCRLAGGDAGSCCEGGCTNMSSDSQNCGGCGVRCENNAACIDSRCSNDCATDTDCPSGTACQGYVGGFPPTGSCIRVTCTQQAEMDICSTNVDGGGGYCCGGSCVPAENTCGVGPTCRQCGAGEICDQGSYACLPPVDCATNSASGGNCLTDAGAAGFCCGPLCVDLAVECGCGSACPGGGTCTGSCPSCDEPSETCPSGFLCQGGSCLRPDCDGTNTSCATDAGPGLCCGDQCVLSSSDGGRCNACGSVCPAGSSCDGSHGCLLPDSGWACHLSGQNLTAHNDCPPGTICTGNEECDPILDCSPSSKTPGYGSCILGPWPDSSGGTCCDDRCVDISRDPQNCGGCGNACASGVCVGYVFPQPLDCLPSEPTNDCVPSCGPQMVCVLGSCVGSACGFDYDAQDFCLAANGTIGICCGTGVCAHPLDDPQNCGVCGNLCPAGDSCINGVCSGSPGCGPDRMFGFCNLDAGPGYACCPGAGCVDIFSDPLNCGSCGSVCPPALTCVGGICQEAKPPPSK